MLETPEMTECLILDVWLPGRSGLEFQADMAKAGLRVPIIFISGHADVHMSVRAMKGRRYRIFHQACSPCGSAGRYSCCGGVRPCNVAASAEGFVTTVEQAFDL